MEIFRDVNALSITVRIILAIAIGGLLGLERGLKNRPAGMRTYILVCVGSALVMMTNQYAFQRWDISDPVRMGAQVVSGIGFLGAGLIIITGRNQIRGITTAAGLWTAACCGLAAGIGFYEGAIAGGLVVLLVMGFMDRFDTRIRHHARSMDLYMEFDSNVRFSDFVDFAKDRGIDISDVQMQKSKNRKESFLSILFTAELTRSAKHGEILEMLHNAPGVGYLEELQ